MGTACETGANSLLVEMTGIVKHFPGVLAVDRVGFDLRPGEVHALLGANGAGKSTLVKILAGVYHRDEGQLLLRGKPAEIHDPRHAQQLGIATIYQEYNLVPDLSVAENVSLGHLPHGALPLKLFINRKETIRRAEELMAELQVDIPPTIPVRRLGVAKQQMVEIAKALALNSEIYIMDEPTAALSSKEIEELFRVTRKMKARGCAIIYISHRLEEVGQIADRVTVMRDGRKVDTLRVEDAPTDRLVELMVGHSVQRTRPRAACTAGKNELLRVEGLSRKGAFHDVSFHICAGEIVGLAGVMGSGRTEIARGIFGADRVDTGSVYVGGKAVTIRSPNDAVKRGMCYLPEDRKTVGLVLCGSVKDNVVLASLSRFCRLRLWGRGIFLDRPRIREEVVRQVTALDIKTPGINQLVEYLSGGNQQKVVVARWLCSKAKVFLFDEPTRGIDVGAKSEIYGLIQSLAEEGACVLLIASEVEELVDVCDRLYVLRQGQIVAEMERGELSKERILSIALTGSGDRTPHGTSVANEARPQGGWKE